VGSDRNRGTYFFEFAPTFYFSNRGFFAGRIEGSYDILITNRLIAQPQFELNFYSKSNPSRGEPTHREIFTYF
jgi:copper resistance protein B